MYKELNQFELGDYNKNYFKVIARLISRKEVQEGIVEETVQQGIFVSDDLCRINQLYDSETEIKEALENQDDSMFELYNHNQLYFDIKNRELDRTSFIGMTDYRIEKKENGYDVILNHGEDLDKLGRPIIDIYRYRPSGRISKIEHIWTSKFNELQINRTNKMKYDLNGMPIIEIHYGKDGKTLYTLDYAYDKKNNVKIEYQRFPDEKELFRYETMIQCSEDGTPLYYVRQNIDRMIIKIGKYIYFDNGSILEIAKVKNV